MSEKRISQCQGKGSLVHNNRETIYKNVDQSRTHNNITYISQPIGEAYEHCFSEPVDRFNEKQTRADRKIKDSYYEHLFNKPPKNYVVTGSNKQKSFYEDLIQIGDKDDTGVGTPDGELAAKCLDEYMRGFSERNPNFYIFNAVLHLDEATPHLHIDYIPIGHYNRGMDTQNGLAQALKEMGYGGGKDVINRWRLAEREVLVKICTENGIEIAEPSKARGYNLLPDEYKAQKDAEIQDITEWIERCEDVSNNFMDSINDLAYEERHLEEILPELRQNVQDTRNDISELESKRNALADEINDIQSAIKKETAAGATIIGSTDELHRLVAQERQNREKEQRYSLLERFIELPAIKPLWERFIEPYIKLKGKSHTLNEKYGDR